MGIGYKAYPIFPIYFLTYIEHIQCFKYFTTAMSLFQQLRQSPHWCVPLGSVAGQVPPDVTTSDVFSKPLTDWSIMWADTLTVKFAQVVICFGWVKFNFAHF